MSKRRHTVTDIVSVVYCEQKLAFDRRHGDARPVGIRLKAAGGTFEHVRFQWEGYSRNPARLLAKMATPRPAYRRASADSRCFIASQVYGPDAVETDVLREWRDRVLMQSRIGRVMVGMYYRVSPALLPILRRSKVLTRASRRVLDRIVRRLGAPL